MRAERVLRDAAAPLIGKIVPPLELEDLHQEGRIALWLKGEGLPDSHRVTIARGAMIDALRRARWVSRGDYRDGAAWEMASYDEWDAEPYTYTDCHAASLVAIKQCIARMQCLPNREREVIACLCDGVEHEAMASRLGVSPSRVSQIVSSLRDVIAADLGFACGAPSRVEPEQLDLSEAIRANNKSGYLGVEPARRGGRWDANIRSGGRRIRLGSFDTPEQAHAAYLSARRRLRAGN